MKKYKYIILGIVAFLLIVATIIMCVLYWQNIFTENTLVIVCAVIFIIMMVGGSFLMWKFKK